MAKERGKPTSPVFDLPNVLDPSQFLQETVRRNYEACNYYSFLTCQHRLHHQEMKRNQDFTSPISNNSSFNVLDTRQLIPLGVVPPVKSTVATLSSSTPSIKYTPSHRSSTPKKAQPKRLKKQQKPVEIPFTSPLQPKETLILPKPTLKRDTGQNNAHNFTHYMEYEDTADEKPCFINILKKCRVIYNKHHNPSAKVIEQKRQKKVAKAEATALFPQITLQHIMELAISSDEVFDMILETVEKLEQQAIPSEIGRNVSQYTFMFLRSESNEKRIINLQDLLQGKKSVRQLNREHQLRHCTSEVISKKRKPSPIENEECQEASSQTRTDQCKTHCDCRLLREEIEGLKQELSRVKDEIMKQLICANQGT